MNLTRPAEPNLNSVHLVKKFRFLKLLSGKFYIRNLNPTKPKRTDFSGNENAALSIPPHLL